MTTLQSLLEGAGIDGFIRIPKSEFVKEHKKLVGILTTGTRKEQRAEAKEQSAELKTKGGGNPKAGFIQRMMAENKLKHDGEYKNPTRPLHPDSTMNAPVPFDYFSMPKESRAMSKHIMDHFFQIRPYRAGEREELNDYERKLLRDAEAERQRRSRARRKAGGARLPFFRDMPKDPEGAVLPFHHLFGEKKGRRARRRAVDEAVKVDSMEQARLRAVGLNPLAEEFVPRNQGRGVKTGGSQASGFVAKKVAEGAIEKTFDVKEPSADLRRRRNETRQTKALSQLKALDTREAIAKRRTAPAPAPAPAPSFIKGSLLDTSIPARSRVMNNPDLRGLIREFEGPKEPKRKELLRIIDLLEKHKDKVKVKSYEDYYHRGQQVVLVEAEDPLFTSFLAEKPNTQGFRKNGIDVRCNGRRGFWRFRIMRPEATTNNWAKVLRENLTNVEDEFITRFHRKQISDAFDTMIEVAQKVFPSSRIGAERHLTDKPVVVDETTGMTAERDDRRYDAWTGDGWARRVVNVVEVVLPLPSYTGPDDDVNPRERIGDTAIPFPDILIYAGDEKKLIVRVAVLSKMFSIPSALQQAKKLWESKTSLL